MKLLILIFFLPTVILQASLCRTLIRDDVPPEFIVNAFTTFDHKIYITHILQLTNQASHQIPTNLLFTNNNTNVPQSSAKIIAIYLSTYELLCSNPASYSSCQKHCTLESLEFRGFATA
ncbi:hypothetical protein QBC44DRAFT_375777 [Cladorrhinum sp. PSN332]|nr:hypothetical protein QBC44DRAFT_375777 [Cladorrhinum sp. PSN332]